MLVIPGALFALIVLHLYLVIRLGVTLAAVVGRMPPGATAVSRRRRRAGGRGLVRPSRRGANGE